MPYKNARRNFAATCGRTIFLYSHESTSLQCREKMTAFYFTTCLANLPQTIRNEGSKIFKVSGPLLRTLSSLVLKPDFLQRFNERVYGRAILWTKLHALLCLVLFSEVFFFMVALPHKCKFVQYHSLPWPA